MFKNEQQRSLLRGTVTQNLTGKLSIENMTSPIGRDSGTATMHINPVTGLFDHPVNNQANYMKKSIETSSQKFTFKKNSNQEFADNQSNGSLLMQRNSSKASRNSLQQINHSRAMQNSVDVQEMLFTADNDMG